MRNIIFLLAILCPLFFWTACGDGSKPANANSETAAANAGPAKNAEPMGDNNSNAANNTQANSSTDVITSPEEGTPAATYKAAFTARNKKDIAGLRKLLSKDMLDLFARMSKTVEQTKPGRRTTVDDMLRRLCDTPQSNLMAVRNVKIDGDKATLEFLDVDSSWELMDLVKEDGVWKITFSKEALDDAREDLDPNG